MLDRSGVCVPTDFSKAISCAPLLPLRCRTDHQPQSKTHGDETSVLRTMGVVALLGLLAPSSWYTSSSTPPNAGVCRLAIYDSNGNVSMLCVSPSACRKQDSRSRVVGWSELCDVEPRRTYFPGFSTTPRLITTIYNRDPGGVT